jgi:hypothetical protein
MDEIRENAHRIVQLIHQTALMRLRTNKLSRRLDNVSGHIDDELKHSRQPFHIVPASISFEQKTDANGSSRIAAP